MGALPNIGERWTRRVRLRKPQSLNAVGLALDREIRQRQTTDQRVVVGVIARNRDIDDPSNLSRRVLQTLRHAEAHLFRDASFAIGMAVRLLSLPAFRLR